MWLPIYSFFIWHLSTVAVWMRCPLYLGQMNTWFPVSGAVWAGLGCVVLLEEVCPWGQAL